MIEFLHRRKEKNAFSKRAIWGNQTLLESILGASVKLCTDQWAIDHDEQMMLSAKNADERARKINQAVAFRLSLGGIR